MDRGLQPARHPRRYLRLAHRRHRLHVPPEHHHQPRSLRRHRQNPRPRPARSLHGLPLQQRRNPPAHQSERPHDGRTRLLRLRPMARRPRRLRLLARQNRPLHRQHPARQLGHFRPARRHPRHRQLPRRLRPAPRHHHQPPPRRQGLALQRIRRRPRPQLAQNPTPSRRLMELRPRRARLRNQPPHRPLRHRPRLPWQQ